MGKSKIKSRQLTVDSKEWGDARKARKAKRESTLKTSASELLFSMGEMNLRNAKILGRRAGNFKRAK